MAVNATAVWRVRPSGNNTNGGGYDAAISGAATDYSQQNSAQASGTHGSTVGTATFVDAIANSFTAAMIGNAVYITGSGQTTGWYFVTGYSSSSTVTLDRSPGTGTGATWALGGGWADFWTNVTTSGPLVQGNTVYLLGSGIPNPASYTYDYNYSGSQFNGPQNQLSLLIVFATDPSTPSYSSGGKACLAVNGLTFNSGSGLYLKNLWFVFTSNNNSGYGLTNGSAYAANCVFDQNGYDMMCLNTCSTINVECFSSVAKRSSNSQPAMQLTPTANLSLTVMGCNVHDTVGPGIQLQQGTVAFNVIAKCGGYGIYCDDSNGHYPSAVFNNTIDGNTGDGIRFRDTANLLLAPIVNNIISNHTTGGTYGFNLLSGTALAADQSALLRDYNSFYNNTTNYNALNAGPHDTVVGSNPYVGQSTENYTLA